MSARALLGVRLDDAPVRQAREALRSAGLAGRSRERDRLPTEEELAALRRYWNGNPRLLLPMADMMDFAAATGMRREEMTRLLWSDLDEATGTILIRDRKAPRRKEGNDQRVPLLFGALEIVLRQPRTSERIFPVKAATISTVFPRACQALGIEDLRWHDLRHAAVTRMFAAGMGLEEVALVSGHRTWAQLKRYTHPKAENLARKYGALARPATPPGSDDGREESGPT